MVAGQVHADHDVGTAIPEHFGWQVRQRTAVHEQALANAGDGQAGQADAGLDGLEQVAAVVDDRLAAGQVGGRDEKDHLVDAPRDMALEDLANAAAAQQPRQPPHLGEGQPRNQALPLISVVRMCSMWSASWPEQ